MSAHEHHGCCSAEPNETLRSWLSRGLLRSVLYTLLIVAAFGSASCSAVLDTDSLQTTSADDGGSVADVFDAGVRDTNADADNTNVEAGMFDASADSGGTVILTLAVVAGEPVDQMDVVAPGPDGSPTLFSLTNGGTAATTAAPVVTLTNLTNFAIIDNGCTQSLAPGASCSFSVRPQATFDGTFDGSLSASADGVTSNALALHGEATGFVASLNLTTANMSALDQMDVVAPATVGTPVTFTVSNAGHAATSGIPTAHLSDTIHFVIGANTCTTVLNPGGSCTINIRPHATANGSYQTTLQINAGDSSSNGLQLSGTASGFVVVLTLTAEAGAALDAMDVTAPDTTGTPVTFTAKNTGGITTNTAPTINRSNPDNFTIVNNTCTAALAVDASCTFQLQPTATADGTFGGTVSVTASSVSSPGLTLSGTAAVSVLELTPSTAQSSMDVTPSTNPGTAVSFTVENTGSGATATTVAPQLSDTTHFVIQNDTCAGASQLAAGTSCTFDVAPTATANGAYSSTLFAAAGSSQTVTVDLSGTATGF